MKTIMGFVFLIAALFLFPLYASADKADCEDACVEYREGSEFIEVLNLTENHGVKTLSRAILSNFIAIIEDTGWTYDNLPREVVFVESVTEQRVPLPVEWDRGAIDKINRNIPGTYPINGKLAESVTEYVLGFELKLTIEISNTVFALAFSSPTFTVALGDTDWTYDNLPGGEFYFSVGGFGSQFPRVRLAVEWDRDAIDKIDRNVPGDTRVFGRLAESVTGFELLSGSAISMTVTIVDLDRPKITGINTSLYVAAAAGYGLAWAWQPPNYVIFVIEGGSVALPVEWDLATLNKIDFSVPGETDVFGWLSPYNADDPLKYTGYVLPDGLELKMLIEVRDGSKPCIHSISDRGIRLPFISIYLAAAPIPGFTFNPVTDDFTLYYSFDEGETWIDMTENVDWINTDNINVLKSGLKFPAWFQIKSNEGYSNIFSIDENGNCRAVGGDRKGADRSGANELPPPTLLPESAPGHTPEPVPDTEPRPTPTPKSAPTLERESEFVYIPTLAAPFPALTTEPGPEPELTPEPGTAPTSEAESAPMPEPVLEHVYLSIPNASFPAPAPEPVYFITEDGKKQIVFSGEFEDLLQIYFNGKKLDKKAGDGGGAYWDLFLADNVDYGLDNSDYASLYGVPIGKASNGSVIVVFHDNFLRVLSEGTHTVAVAFEGGLTDSLDFVIEHNEIESVGVSAYVPEQPVYLSAIPPITPNAFPFPAIGFTLLGLGLCAVAAAAALKFTGKKL